MSHINTSPKLIIFKTSLPFLVKHFENTNLICIIAIKATEIVKIILFFIEDELYIKRIVLCDKKGLFCHEDVNY